MHILGCLPASFTKYHNMNLIRLLQKLVLKLQFPVNFSAVGQTRRGVAYVA